MNKRVIEQARGNSRTHRGFHRKLLPVLIAACFGAGQVQANPLGAQVVSGQVSISSQGNVLTVTNSPGAIINWQSFSIGASELTRFVQQGASSTVLNRILGQDPSRILGALQSNGRVFLVNPNGILFGQGAQVNVAGLVASTLNISNEDFLAGRMKFQAGDKAAGLQNQGSIATSAGGQIYLVAPNVENSGILTSPRGEVVLAAGHSVHLVDGANPDLHVVVSAPENQAVNLGQIVAESGRIGIYGALIRQRGLASADSAVVGENGKIVFKASRDALLEAGSRTTATGAGSGGTVHVLGERVGLTGDAKIDVSGQTGGGTALVGGDYQGSNAAVMNATQTLLGRDAEIRADAGQQGEGGKVIVWSDELTRAYGAISAKGGAQGGDGGLVEVSGKRRLVFDAMVNTGAVNGKAGMLLLDPQDIIIQTGPAASGDTALSFDNFVDGADAGAFTDITISEGKLETLSGSVTLQASRDVILQDLADNSLTLANAAGGSTFSISAGRDIRADDGNDFIQTGGASINLTASSGNISVGNVSSGGGAVTMNAAGTLSAGSISSTNGSSAGNISLTSGGLMTLGGTGGINAMAAAPGDVRLAAGGAIRMMNGNIISASRLKASAVGGIGDGFGGALQTQVATLNTVNSGAGDINVYNSGSLTIDGIDGAVYGIKQDAAGYHAIVDATGNLNILSSVSTSNGDISLWAGAGMSNAATVSATSGNVSLMADGSNLQNNGAVQSGNGSVYLYASSSTGTINNMGTVSAVNGVVALDAGAGINHYGTISSNGGYVQLSVNNAEATLYTDAASQIASPGGTIDLIADKMDLNGTVDSASGYVWLMPGSSVTAIDVGTGNTNDTAATLELSNAELNRITASKLIIGDGTSTGTLTLKSGLFGGIGGALEHVSGVVSFHTNGHITQDPGAIIAVPAVEAVGASVALMEANPTGVVSGESTAGDFEYRTTNLLTLSYGHLHAGIMAPSTRAVRLQSDSLAGINQHVGSPVVADQLVLQTPGPVMLDDPGNNVTRLAADLYVGGTGTGSFAMRNSASLMIDGSLFGITGITTNNRNVEISVPSASFTITENQPIVTGAGTKTLRYDGLLSGSAMTTTTTTSTSTTSTSTTSTSTTSTSTTATTSTITSGTTTTTLAHTAAQDPALQEAVTSNSTNTIVAATSTVMPETASGSAGTQQEKEQDASRSNDAIVREEPSGASKNEVAQKLYCN